VDGNAEIDRRKEESEKGMSETTWKVTYHYPDRDEHIIVSGWKPILQLVRGARRAGVRYVDVGAKIGPALTRFVMS
jgi:hypothetical protein